MATNTRGTAEKSSRFQYSFGGPNGVLGILISLPLFVIFMLTYCQSVSGQCDFCWLDFHSQFLNRVFLQIIGAVNKPISAALVSLFDLEGFKWYIGWFAFQAALYFLPVGRIVEGLPLSTEKRLKYHCNGKLHLNSIPHIVLNAWNCQILKKKKFNKNFFHIFYYYLLIFSLFFFEILLVEINVTNRSTWILFLNNKLKMCNKNSSMKVFVSVYQINRF